MAFSDAVQSTQFATIDFEDPKSTQSALLLDSAILFDLAISVKPLTPQLENELKQKTASSPASKESKTTGEKTQTSVVASLVASKRYFFCFKILNIKKRWLSNWCKHN